MTLSSLIQWLDKKAYIPVPIVNKVLKYRTFIKTDSLILKYDSYSWAVRDVTMTVPIVFIWPSQTSDSDTENYDIYDSDLHLRWIICNSNVCIPVHF